MTKSWALCYAILLVLSSNLFAQVAIGTPPFNSFGGGPFDTVNLGNLNVHFAIPVVNKAGRGMPFVYNLVYDSSIWQPVLSDGTISWTNTTATTWGWTTSIPRGGHVAYNTFTTTAHCEESSGGLGTETTVHYSNWVYYDGVGTSHSFADYISDVMSGCFSESNGFTATASDGSGYTLTVNGGTVTSLIAEDGAIINATTGAISVQDSNGNQITSVNSSGTTTYTDTLGATAMVTSGSGTASSPLTFTYPAPASGATTCNPISQCVSYTMNFTQYTVKTNFEVPNVNEYGPLADPLVSSISLPDGTSYAFTYEKTPGSCTPISGTYSANCVTGRIASVKLPTGGTITYTYTGGSNGIESDGSTAGLTRTLNPGGEWQYSRALQTGSSPIGPGSTWTTTEVDPSGNNTVMNFAEDSTTTNAGSNPPTVATYNFYETQQQVYQGSISSSNLLVTNIICYNAVYTSCSTGTAASPITQTDTYTQLPNGSTRLSELQYNGSFSGSGLVSLDSEYNYGVALNAAPSSTYLVRQTSISYASLGNGILNKPSSVKILDWSNKEATLAESTYSYDGTSLNTSSGTPQHVSVSGSRGNLTTVLNVTSFPGGLAEGLSQTFSYYDTGNVYQANDVNGAQTTYVYGSASCGNSFPTTIDEPLSLTRSITWNCTGGVATQVTDENGNNVTSSYTDPDFWRPANIVDQMLNQTTVAYTGQTAVETTLSFNSGNSVSDFLSTVDGFGRLTFSQQKQGPSATNYDTTETDYNNIGQPYITRMPYSATASPSSDNTSAPATTTIYDALGRAVSVQDADGGTVSYTYSNNDVLQTVSGTQSFEKQFEYDGLGRLTSVCEINVSGNLPDTGTCGQNTTQNGYWTKYTYNALGRLLTVTQNAQASTGQQARSFTYDMLGRMTSETNPETGNNGTSGTISYTYDGGCTSTPAYCGNLTSKVDAAGNTTNFTYDLLHRLLTAGNSGISGATLRSFVYDSKSPLPSGVTVSNTKTQLLEATTTTTSGSVLTDEYFGYNADGQLTDVYESTPHYSSSYYHTTTKYWPNGALETLSGIPGVPTIYYGTNSSNATTLLDGEGRYLATDAGSGTNPVTSVSYSTSSTSNPLGALTGVTYGSSDTDSFTYDPNTGRPKTYTFTMNGKTDASTLTWNTNGTIQQLAINDQISGTSDTQTCSYSYDDLARVAANSTTPGVKCVNGSNTVWSQTFAYDAFGNITKSGTGTFNPSYTFTNSSGQNVFTNQFYSIPGVTVSYDANGNLLKDNLNSYTWDPNWGNMLSVNTGSEIVNATYDALGRMVELYNGLAYTQILYSPVGKTALMSGSTLTKAFIPLPGAGTAIYNSSSGSPVYYRHADWLGSSRLTSTAARAMYSSMAYAPFGEQYSIAGTADTSFTGQNSDTVASLYDFTFREHSPSQGRWISPDPLGVGAVNPANPQSWNRYAYVFNNPLAVVDALGLYGYCPSGIQIINPDGTTTCVIELNWMDPVNVGSSLTGTFGEGGGYGFQDNSNTCKFNIGVKNTNLLSSQEAINASQEIQRILSLAGLAANFTNNNPDFTIDLANNSTSWWGALFGPSYETLGQNNASYTPTNSATVWVNSTEMAAAGMDMGITLGRVMTHEFGHWALNMVHNYVNPGPLEVDIMSQGFDDLMNGNAALSPQQIALLKQKCQQLRGGQ